MANSRPDSMIIPSEVFDETNISNKNSRQFNTRSSASSIESTSGKNVNFNEQNSFPQNPTSTTSTTTTDSDSGSEQDYNNHLNQQKNDSSASDQLSRRAKHFQKLFQTEIPDDVPDLIDSYVCAYQGDILLQGKMYITDRYLCFHSRIINYVTKHVYRWEQIESVTKERVAFIFPTAIGIQLKPTGKKISYASFLQRDQAYDKILSIWSRFTNDNHSYNDDENDLAQDGTLKATNHNEKNKFIRRESFDIVDAPDQDVLQMCLKKNQRRPSSVPRKIIDDKPSTKKYEKKSSTKNSNLEKKSSNESTNQTTRPSRYTKNEQRSNETSKRATSVANHRPKSHSRNRTDEISSNPNSSSTITPNINPPITNSNSNGILNIIISFLNQINQYISSLFPSYPMKITIIILLVLTILFLHSFYLIKLTYRIENRLQSLHHQWPSSSAMKNSFSSNTKDL